MCFTISFYFFPKYERDESNGITKAYNYSPFMSMNRLKKRIGLRKKKWARSFIPTLKGFLSSSFRCVWTDKRRSFSISLHNLSSKCYLERLKIKPYSVPNCRALLIELTSLFKYVLRAFFSSQEEWFRAICLDNKTSFSNLPQNMQYLFLN